mmetsp:Transcript_10186/g.32388  ORF Transcript_10186/g.32388 Transcript_10186/m.32388 type:complete len:102 (-) Transcript_10186:519-824(-)
MLAELWVALQSEGARTCGGAKKLGAASGGLGLPGLFPSIALAGSLWLSAAAAAAYLCSYHCCRRADAAPAFREGGLQVCSHSSQAEKLHIFLDGVYLRESL